MIKKGYEYFSERNENIIKGIQKDLKCTKKRAIEILRREFRKRLYSKKGEELMKNMQ